MVSVTVGVRVDVEVGVTEAVPVRMEGVPLRVGVGDWFAVVVIVAVGVIFPGCGANISATPPRQ
jgi:hypothetical protein